MYFESPRAAFARIAREDVLWGWCPRCGERTNQTHLGNHLYQCAACLDVHVIGGRNERNGVRSEKHENGS